MATINGNSGKYTLLDELRDWWKRPLLCRIGLHSWETGERQMEGIDISFRTVQGIEKWRSCRRCDSYESEARAIRK